MAEKGREGKGREEANRRKARTQGEEDGERVEEGVDPNGANRAKNHIDCPNFNFFHLNRRHDTIFKETEEHLSHLSLTLFGISPATVK